MDKVSRWHILHLLLFIVAEQTLWKIPYTMMYSTAKLLGFSHAKLVSFCMNFSFPGISCSSNFIGTYVGVEKTVYVHICWNWICNTHKFLCELYMLVHSTCKWQSLRSVCLAPCIAQGKAIFTKASCSQSFSSFVLKLLNASMILNRKMSVKLLSPPVILYLK